MLVECMFNNVELAGLECFERFWKKFDCFLTVLKCVKVYTCIDCELERIP